MIVSRCEHDHNFRRLYRSRMRKHRLGTGLCLYLIALMVTAFASVGKVQLCTECECSYGSKTAKGLLNHKARVHSNEVGGLDDVVLLGDIYVSVVT